MHGNIIEDHEPLNNCKCGTQPIVIWHYITGTPNRIHYFVRCLNCKVSTNDRKKYENAIDEWNNK